MGGMTVKRATIAPPSLTLIAMMLAATQGCTELPPGEWERLNQAKAACQRHDYRAAMPTLDDILSKYPNANGAADAYFLRSLCHGYLSNKVQAEADARSCIEKSKSPALTADAHATLAVLLLEANRSPEALTHFDQAFQGGPPRPNEDLLRYRYGLCLQREGRWKEAQDAFSAVLKLNPGGGAANHARRAHEWRNEFYSIQCGAFRDAGGADQLKTRLAKLGLKSWVAPHSRAGEPLHTVFVGRYSRYDEARDAVAEVQRHAAGAFIVP